jgi:hypothetical protein
LKIKTAHANKKQQVPDFDGVDKAIKKQPKVKEAVKKALIVDKEPTGKKAIKVTTTVVKLETPRSGTTSKSSVRTSKSKSAAKKVTKAPKSDTKKR